MTHLIDSTPTDSQERINDLIESSEMQIKIIRALIVVVFILIGLYWYKDYDTNRTEKLLEKRIENLENSKQSILKNL